MRLVTVVVAALLAAGCAGTRTPRSLPSLCETERTGPGEPDAAEWIRLILRGVDPETRRVTSPAIDCSGAQVRWEGPALACQDGTLARTALPDRPLAVEDVVTGPAGPGLRLVWIVTGRYASGEAVGPVALVDEGGRTLRVVALGALRAYPRAARLRLEQLGRQTVMVAEGESCGAQDQASCLRAARLLPLSGARLVPTPVTRAEGGCLAPAWLELARREVRRTEGRWEQVELGSQLIFSPAGLEIEELVAVGELPSREAVRPSRLLHRAQGTRTVRWQDGRLVGDGEPLWLKLAGRP